MLDKLLKKEPKKWHDMTVKEQREKQPSQFSVLELRCPDCGRYSKVNLKDSLCDFTKMVFVADCECGKRPVCYFEHRKWLHKSTMEKYLREIGKLGK